MVMISIRIRTPSWLGVLLLLCVGIAPLEARALALQGAGISSGNALATQAGFEILRAGGNAFDAAVAVSAALAVVEPFGSGLGGGAFWLLHRAADGHDIMVDGRERAPLAARPDMYLDAQGRPVPRASLDGPLAAGIPGIPAGLVHLARHYGRLPLARSLAPAIRYARDGVPVGWRYVRVAQDNQASLLKNARARAIFLDHGDIPRPGFRLLQPALAGTLKALAREGHAGFYAGPVAAELVRSVRRGGGIWSLEDLRRYRIIERAPIRFRYRNATVISVAPPSSGGVVLAESLHILEHLPGPQADPAQRMHDVIEAMRRGYQDRARYLGDPAFVAMPLRRLLDPAYAAARAHTIHADRATPSLDLGDPVEPARQGTHTTHFSIIDGEGNRVAGTMSLNTLFGSGFVAGTTGVLLNNEMDDFVLKPGVPNVYGLVGTSANAIEPGKRPLSSMTPTFVESPRGVLVLGTPGGSRIISMVLLGILDFVDHPASTVQHIVSLPRYHHQYLPDRVDAESTVPSALLDALRLRGHVIHVLPRPWGDMHAVYLDARNGRVEAADDPRGEGASMTENPFLPPLSHSSRRAPVPMSLPMY